MTHVENISNTSCMQETLTKTALVEQSYPVFPVCFFDKHFVKSTAQPTFCLRAVRENIYFCKFWHMQNLVLDIFVSCSSYLTKRFLMSLWAKMVG